MKRVIILILVLICISMLIGSCNKTKGIANSLNFSFDKNGDYAGFSDIPLNYKIEEAKDDGYFVTRNLEVIANKNVWDKFVKTSLRKENTSIRVVKFFPESSDNPFFLDLFYEDGYYYLFDSSAEKKEKQPYLHLLTLEGQFGSPLRDSGIIVLTNDDTLTFDKVMRAMFSSNTEYIKSVSPYKIVMLNKVIKVPLIM